MKKLNISEARNTLPALVESVSSTREPVVLLRYGKPVAMLVPVEEKKMQTDPYPLRGLPITISEGFDVPLSELWEAYGVAEKKEDYRSGAKRKATASCKGKKA